MISKITLVKKFSILLQWKIYEIALGKYREFSVSSFLFMTYRKEDTIVDDTPIGVILD